MSLILIAFALPINAATLASAAIVLPDELIPPETKITSQQTFDDLFELLVTGGTGTGLVFFDNSLFGTNDVAPNEHQWALEGDATLTVSTSSGFNATMYTVEGYPNECVFTSNPACYVPFTFGVPEIVELSGSAYAYFESMSPNFVYLPGLLGWPALR